MIAYATIGVSDLKRAYPFYQALADELEAQHFLGSLDDSFIAWVGPNHEPGIGITLPYNGEPQTVGNGMMIALAAKDPAQVDRLYDIAIAQGGSCEGKPGPRGENFYAAYFRDLDGNKLNAFVQTV